MLSFIATGVLLSSNGFRVVSLQRIVAKLNSERAGFKQYFSRNDDIDDDEHPIKVSPCRISYLLLAFLICVDQCIF